MVSVAIQSSCEPAIVGINKDATLTIDQKTIDQIEYDTSLVEFGELESRLVQFMKQWYGWHPPDAILLYVMEKRNAVRLVADYAEHVLWICKSFTPDQYGRLERGIQATRFFMDDRITVSEHLSFKKSVIDANTEINEMYEDGVIQHSDAARFAGLSVSFLTESAQDLVSWPNLELSRALNVSTTACMAMAHYDEPLEDQLSKNFQEARQKEMHWQIRRFVDVMEALQSEKSWPPLEATK